jgi:DNA primase
MIIRNGILEPIRDTVDPLKVISKYTELRATKYFGKCPFCGNDDFEVNAKTGIYSCYACGSGGDVFTIVMERENVNLSDAAAFIQKHYMK